MLSVQKASLSSGAEMRDKFQQLSSKFTRLMNGRSEGDRQQINTVFDDLNALDFKITFVTNTSAAVLLINQCCSIVPSNDTFLVAKGCQLISNLVNKQDVKVEGKTLAVVINWIVQSLKYSADIALLDILIALQAIVRGNGRNITSDVKDLVGPNAILISFLNPLKGNELKLAMPWEIHLATLQCLESLTCPTAESKQEEEQSSYLEPYQEIFLKQLEYNRAGKQDEINYCKILATSIRGLQNVVQQSTELSNQYLGDLLGVIKAYMLYGLPGHSGLKPERIYSTHVGAGQSDLPTSAEKFSRPKANKTVRTRKKRSTKTQKKGSTPSEDDSNDIQDLKPTSNNFRIYTLDKLNNTADECKPLHPSWLKTSESDFSDTEGGQSAKIRSSQGKVRQCALTLMLAVIKVSERKILFGYWFSFLPAGPSTPQTRTLITCLLKDPSSRNRMAILNIIVSLLLGSRNYLLQAESSKKASTSFTPFSISLGYLVEELHRSLCLALISEHSTSVKMHILKCIAALVQNTPYHRLDVGLITKIVRNVRGLLKLNDSVIHVAVLTVFGSIASVEYSLPEITEQLAKPMQNRVRQDMVAAPQEVHLAKSVDMDLLENEYVEDFDDSFPSCVSTNQVGLSWILEHCLDILSDPLEIVGTGENKQWNISLSIPVKIESLQVLTVLSRNFFAPIVAPQLNTVVKALQFSLNDPDLVIRRHVGHVIEGIGLSIQASLQSNANPAPITLDASVNFWQTMLSGPVIAMIQNDIDVTLRTVGCDCLASIGSDIFQELTRDKQIIIITMLFGCCQDEDHNVRSSSIRALAMCILFPTLREDIHFVIDTAESVMRSLKDKLTVVRVKSSWALGNLSDALVLNSRAQMEEIPDALLVQLLDASIEASQDNDKIRSNAVRSVGNLLLLYTEALMKKPNFKLIVDKAINSLVRNATTGNNMKVRWNACYAIGNMLKNHVLYQDNSAGLASVFQTLTILVVNFRNFKVRINAAAALATPVSRAMYGPHFVTIWEGLMKGLDNSQTMEDFSEYKHQDNLVNQICLTLIHLMMLVTREDLSPLQDILLLHLETLQKQMHRFHMRVVPEKEGDLMAAALHAKSLIQLPILTSEQRNAGTLLVNIFSQDKEF